MIRTEGRWQNARHGIALHPDIDIDRLVFIDETGASTKMASLYGRSPRVRADRFASHGQRQTATFVGAQQRQWCSTAPWMAWHLAPRNRVADPP
jgi:hypothetical protein